MMTAAAMDPARSFEAWAPEYDRYRPSYPYALFELIASKLELPRRPLVVDLGAGTGRASLAMAELGWRVTAVEPGGPMLDMLRIRATDAGLLVATVQAHAEETGLDPASVDLATAAQAFHWFDRARAVDEMARIVRPGGGVALFWNVRDEHGSPFVAGYHSLLEAQFGDADTGRYLQAGRATGRDATRVAFEGMASFERLELSEVSHDLAMSADEFIGMAFTASYVRSLDGDAQARFRDELVHLLTQHGLTTGRFNVPYRIDLWTARRSDR
jgi:SAM-dependent methyltransferase